MKQKVGMDHFLNITNLRLPYKVNMILYIFAKRCYKFWLDLVASLRFFSKFSVFLEPMLQKHVKTCSIGHFIYGS